LSWVEIVSNLELRLVPIALTLAMITIEMPAAIRPYSIAVAPDVLQERKNPGHATHSMWPDERHNGAMPLARISLSRREDGTD